MDLSVILELAFRLSSYLQHTKLCLAPLQISFITLLFAYSSFRKFDHRPSNPMFLHLDCIPIQRLLTCRYVLRTLPSSSCPGPWFGSGTKIAAPTPSSHLPSEVVSCLPLNIVSHFQPSPLPTFQRVLLLTRLTPVTHKTRKSRKIHELLASEF